jgi:hypothetical protein
MVEPKYQFDVFISKDPTNLHHIATVNKTLFPPISHTGLFQLDENKYQKYFQIFRELYGEETPLPTKLFEYSVDINDTDIVISGITEITTRIAIVELISDVVLNPDIKIKMIRHPYNFRVYYSDTVNNDNIEFGNIFGISDY